MQPRWTLQRFPWTTSGEDAHGNPINGYGEPVDLRVFGWAVPASEEPSPSTQDRVIVDVKVYVPPSETVGRRDRVVIDVGPNAGTFEVIGEVEDYTHGPFGWEPGVVVNLQRVEG